MAHQGLTKEDPYPIGRGFYGREGGPLEEVVAPEETVKEVDLNILFPEEVRSESTLPDGRQKAPAGRQTE
jgi:hypothetical protein